MQPSAAAAAVVLTLAAPITSALAASSTTAIRIGVALQLSSDVERLKGLRLLETFANGPQAASPFRLSNGSRIALKLVLRYYTAAPDMVRAYVDMAQHVDMFIGPHAISTGESEVGLVLESTRGFQKVMMLDMIYNPGDAALDSDRYPYAFFSGMDGSSFMTGSLQRVLDAWGNSSTALQQPSLVVVSGCSNTADCPTPTAMCESAAHAGQSMGYNMLGKFSFEDTSLPRIIQQIRALNPDVAVFCVCSEPRAVNVVVTSRALGFAPRALVMDTATNERVIDAVGASNANYLMSPAVWDHRKSGLACRLFGSASGFNDAFHQRFGEPATSLSASAAAAGFALLAGVENVGRWPLTAQELSRGLYSLNVSSFYRRLAFGPNRTLLDADTLIQQARPLDASYDSAERYTVSDVKLLDGGEVPLYPMPVWAEKALDVFPCRAGYVVDPTATNLTCIGCPGGTERRSSELECQACPVGFFSASPGQETCTACPRGSDCTLSSRAVLPPAQVGYYMMPHFKNGQPVYMECDEDVCAGDNKCFGGNSGVLCSHCLHEFTNVGMSLQGKSSVCSECPSTVRGIVTLLVVIVCISIVIGVVMRMTKASSMSVWAIHSVLLRIFVNYIHMFCTVSVVTWMGNVPLVSFIVDVNLAPLTSHGFVDCLLHDLGANMYKVQTVVGLTMVPLVVVVVYIIHQVGLFLELRRIDQKAYQYVDSGSDAPEHRAYGRRTSTTSTSRATTNTSNEGAGADRTDRRAVTLNSRRLQALQNAISARRRWAIVLTFFLYPIMVRKLVLALMCKELDVMRLSVDSRVECLHGDHVFWFIAAVLGLVVYGLGIPLVLFIALHRCKDRLMESFERRTYGFLYNGFQPDFFYFEAVYMVRKFVFLVLGCVPSYTTRMLVMFMFTCCFLGIQIRCQPYDNRDFFAMDQLETACLLALLITLAMCIMYNSDESGEGSNLVGSQAGEVFVGLASAVVGLAHAYCWTYMLWCLMRNLFIRHLHFKGECAPNSVGRFGRILLKTEPNMNASRYERRTHSMNLKKLTRRERTFFKHALCDTMERYIENGTTFHPARVATCLRLAVELCISDRKQRARLLCKKMAERMAEKKKRGLNELLKDWCAEVKSSCLGSGKALDSGIDDLSSRRKLPKGATALLRQAMLKVGEPIVVIEELQNALMLCERHIIIGKGNGPFFEIDKPSADRAARSDTEDDEREKDNSTEQEGDDSKWKVDTKVLFGSMSARSYMPDDLGEEESPQDVRLQLGREGGLSGVLEQEFSLDAKALRRRQTHLAAEARALKSRAEKLQRQLLEAEEPEHSTAPVHFQAQPAQGRELGELQLARTTDEDDLKDDLKALRSSAQGSNQDMEEFLTGLMERKADSERDRQALTGVVPQTEAERRNQDMEEFLAGLMETQVGKYWRYTPANGAAVSIRAAPAINGADSGNVMQPGSTFRVCEELKGENNVLFLKLADGRGWLFDRKPGVGVMCVRETS